MIPYKSKENPKPNIKDKGNPRLKFNIKIDLVPSESLPMARIIPNKLIEIHCVIILII